MSEKEKTLLIADDEKDIVNVCVRVAQKIGYTSILTAYNGQKAMELLDHADVYLFDVNMPEKTGLELLAEVRLRDSKPVIMMTGKVTEEQEQTIKQAGANHYLQKPLEIPKLINLLKQYLN